MRELEVGDLVVLRRTYVGYPDSVKPFLRERRRVIKYTKAGLVNIHVDGDARKRTSVAEYQLEKLIY